MASSHKRISRKKHRAREYHSFVGLFVPGIVLGLCFSGASCAAAVGFDTTKDKWALAGGYSQSFPGWVQTTQRVKTVDLVPRYNHRIFDDVGSGWYNGFHSLLLERPVSITGNQSVWRWWIGI